MATKAHRFADARVTRLAGTGKFVKASGKQAAEVAIRGDQGAVVPEQGGVLGLKGEAAAALVRRIDNGLPYAMVNAFQRSTALSMEAIAELMRVPSRTFSRRKQEGKFSPDESERLLRAARVVDRAVDLFEGDAAAAMRWLQTPQPALGHVKPLEFARTDVGAREVEDLIGRLEHGVLP